VIGKEDDKKCGRERREDGIRRGVLIYRWQPQLRLQRKVRDPERGE
jgi:hypothetical protein